MFVIDIVGSNSLANSGLAFWFPIIVACISALALIFTAYKSAATLHAIKKSEYKIAVRNSILLLFSEAVAVCQIEATVDDKFRTNWKGLISKLRLLASETDAKIEKKLDELEKLFADPAIVTVDGAAIGQLINVFSLVLKQVKV